MRILIAEDDNVSRRLLQAMLTKWGYEVEVTRDGPEALHALQKEHAPGLAILDWMMPGMDGIDVCRAIRQQTDGPYIYVILLTTRNRREDIVEGIDAGADDYVTKPFDAHELQARVRAGVRILDLQSALLAAQDELRLRAAQDALTGLWNHAVIVETLERELERAHREGAPVGVVMADLDHFKRINDAHGHVAGDCVLCEVVSRMLGVVRSYDYIGRYGGEEFLIVAPGCDSTATFELGERIRQAIGEAPCATPEGPVLVRISVGTTACDRGQTCDAGALIRAADAALYQAKAEGRNRVVAAPVPDSAEALLLVSSVKA